MNTVRILTTAAFATAIAVTTALAQQPQAQRLRGTIEKVDGNTLLIKGPDGAPVTLKLADNAVVVGVLKATVADIKEGSYIGSGALPQPDGTQKAVEVHIFAESQRGTGDGHRGNWDGTSYGAGIGTMTNGAVGQAVSSVDGPVVTVKYKDGEKKITVPANAPIVAYVPGDKNDIKPGAKVFIVAVKQADGTYQGRAWRIGRDGLTPPM